MVTAWLSKLKTGLKSSSHKVVDQIQGVFTRKKLDDELLETLEEALIMSDLGVQVASKLCATLAKTRYEKDITEEEVRQIFANHIAEILRPYAIPFQVNPAHGPHVVVMCGVNGNGKTTTIGKLAHQAKEAGHSVMLAACDTFRAAAVEQLAVWSERVGCLLVSGEPEADPASVAYRALEKAKADGVDVLFIDTAGRLQNKSNLMEELAKILRVMQKIDPSAPHEISLVLDATTGQNALQQAQIFKEIVNINSLIVTKLDGSAKGGVVVALAEKFHLPIHAIGVGETIQDLQSFDPDEFANQLMGL